MYKKLLLWTLVAFGVMGNLGCGSEAVSPGSAVPPAPPAPIECEDETFVDIHGKSETQDILYAGTVLTGAMKVNFRCKKPVQLKSVDLFVYNRPDSVRIEIEVVKATGTPPLSKILSLDLTKLADYQRGDYELISFPLSRGQLPSIDPGPGDTLRFKVVALVWLVPGKEKKIKVDIRSIHYTMGSDDNHLRKYSGENGEEPIFSGDFVNFKG